MISQESRSYCIFSHERVTTYFSVTEITGLYEIVILLKRNTLISINGKMEELRRNCSKIFKCYNESIA